MQSIGSTDQKAGTCGGRELCSGGSSMVARCVAAQARVLIVISAASTLIFYYLIRATGTNKNFSDEAYDTFHSSSGMLDSVLAPRSQE